MLCCYGVKDCVVKELGGAVLSPLMILQCSLTYVFTHIPDSFIQYSLVGVRLLSLSCTVRL